MVNEDLSSVFILDNSPGAYRYNPGKSIMWLSTTLVYGDPLAESSQAHVHSKIRTGTAPTGFPVNFLFYLLFLSVFCWFHTIIGNWKKKQCFKYNFLIYSNEIIFTAVTPSLHFNRPFNKILFIFFFEKQHFTLFLYLQDINVFQHYKVCTCSITYIFFNDLVEHEFYQNIFCI